MDTLIIKNTKFILIEQKKFDKIQLAAAKKTPGVKKLSLAAGRKHALKLIEQWGKEK
ncbi:MAG: hypothetical protein IPI66_10765 [Chitinophagaceae bacterium]|nr:hypothetical protein [Chitinophagaceae bacterium]MBL0056512.1 hypothetical protein [Chitinophagaceae bacterium]